LPIVTSPSTAPTSLVEGATAWDAGVLALASPPPLLAAIMGEGTQAPAGSDLRMVKELLRLIEQWCGARLHDATRRSDVANSRSGNRPCFC